MRFGLRPGRGLGLGLGLGLGVAVSSRRAFLGEIVRRHILLSSRKPMDPPPSASKLSKMLEITALGACSEEAGRAREWQQRRRPRAGEYPKEGGAADGSAYTYCVVEIVGDGGGSHVEAELFHRVVELLFAHLAR